MKSIEHSVGRISKPSIDEPVPTISDNIVHFINQVISKYNFTHFVEYGMGNSTRYFLKIVLNNKKRLNFISIEFDPKWYFTTMSLIRDNFTSGSDNANQAIKSIWPYSKCKDYLKAKNMSTLSIPQDLQRLEKGKRKIAGKYYYKFLFYSLIKSTRPFDAIFSLMIANTINLNLILSRDFIKDQYGESPKKNEYIGAPFKLFMDELNKSKNVIALFLIDGGPRHEILERIFDIEEKYNNFFPIIFLCDANRVFYNSQIQRRAKGIFLQGSNITLNKLKLYTNDDKRYKSEFIYGKGEVTDSDLAEKEVWYYNSLSSLL